MIDARQRNWALYGLFVFCVLLAASGFLSIADEIFGMRFRELDSISSAPENLASAPESFWLKLRDEAPEVTVEEMTKTQAWSDLQEKVSAYAHRLEVMNRQRFWLSMGVSLAILAAAIGTLIMVLHLRESPEGRKADPEVA